MKNLLVISLFLFLVSCIDEVVEPMPELNENVFSHQESSVTNGLEIQFELPKNGVYFLSMIDTETNQLVTKEKFVGIIGLNKLNIYTKSVQSRYLYLVLHDENKIELSKTKLVLK